MVSQELLEELGMIFKEDYQIDLQPQELSEIGNTLVNYFELLAKIDNEEGHKTDDSLEKSGG